MFRTRPLILVAVLLMATLLAGMLLPISAAARVKLTVWGIDPPDDNPANAYIKALVNGFKAKNPDVELDYAPLGNDPLKDKTKVAMMSGQGLPDIFQGWGGSTLGQYADMGRLLDLTKELKSVKGSSAAQEAMSWKKKIYGVAPFFGIAGMFINEGIFKANGLKAPKTIAEFEKVCDALLAKGIQPATIGARDKWPVLAMYMYLVDRYGGITAFTDASGTAPKYDDRKIRFDSDVFVKAAQVYQKWAKAGYFGKDPLGEAYGDAQGLMATGKAAIQVSGSWLCANYVDKTFTDQTFGFYAFPELTGGKGKVTDVMGMTDIGFAATKEAASKKDAAVRFLKYAMSVEACSAEPGRICSVPGVKAPSTLTAQAAAVFSKAKAIQFWWDQDLLPSVTSPLNDTLQNFLIPNADVKKALTQYEVLVADNVAPVKK